ncbi:protein MICRORCHIDIA 6-like isoform X1 [Oryza brachyantha]|uniref:protein MICRORCHIDIA 6-like isoform X1 n=1 Tax=Oryza brachyantha TaxID=4533 RepID=UPI001ADB518A|nr:protein MICRORCHIDIA 6-like isoform X1 [Oryza brachyantha]
MRSAAEVIDLSSDDDGGGGQEELAPSTSGGARRVVPASPHDVTPNSLVDVKPALLYPLQPPGVGVGVGGGGGALVPVKEELPLPLPVPLLAARASSSPGVPALPPPRLCRQFWKSGDYVVAQRNPDTDALGGRNRLRINPKFLHSNATSHKWAFGAIAELLDNAIDEVNTGATFVRVDEFTNPRDGNPSLLIQDDGGGMDPEGLRRCMSFGFSDKQSDAFIGQYGNGFKTSTMRLGADVIVFTQNQNNWVPTRSIGLLSYTFLMETGCDDVLVPTVDYQYDPTTASYTQMLRHDQKLFSSNLAILLKWSPFASEAELLKQFDDIGEHGTKIIVFNLWFNDDGDMELDFNSDEKDILITGSHKKVKTNKAEKIATQSYVSTRLRYSLRQAYTSVLYLHIPDNFRIVLRGHDVESHNVINDLMYPECVLYKPQIAGLAELSAITTIGFVKGAPDIDVQGFNVYHKNRLIAPFWKVANNSYGKGRGVVGILEANFIKPTHDKQDFEKSVLYQRLENRLKEMTYEYWDLHCHRIGYDNKKLPKASRALYRANQMNAGSSPPSAPRQLLAADIPTSRSAVPTFMNPVLRQKQMGLKRNFDALGSKTDSADQDGVPSDVSQRRRFNEYRTLTLENDKLRGECLQYEESAKQLALKEQKLRSQIAEERKKYDQLLQELRSLDVKTEK